MIWEIIARSGLRNTYGSAENIQAVENAGIRQIHGASRGTYGAPRIHAELADAYRLRYGRKRVARLMRRAGLVGVCRRRVVRTTRTVATPSLPT